MIADLKALGRLWLVIGTGALLIFIDFRIFVFFAFVITVMLIELKSDYTRKIIRVFHIANEVKIVAIMNKLGVTADDAQVIFDKMQEGLTAKALAELENDFEGVVNLNNIKQKE